MSNPRIQKKSWGGMKLNEGRERIEGNRFSDEKRCRLPLQWTEKRLILRWGRVVVSSRGCCRYLRSSPAPAACSAWLRAPDRELKSRLAASGRCSLRSLPIDAHRARRRRLLLAECAPGRAPQPCLASGRYPLRSATKLARFTTPRRTCI
jgi:hypothetical protein